MVSPVTSQPSPDVPLRLLHCDDSEDMRELLRAALQPHPAVQVTGSVATHGEAVTQAGSLQPDVVVLDIDAERDDGVVTRLRDVCSAQILVFSGEPDLAEDPIARAADAIVPKASGPTALTEAVLGARPSGAA